MKKTSKKKSEGFTLIEILIVIFIISILSAFFVYSTRTPDATRNARVESNLNQISTAAAILKNKESDYRSLSCSNTETGIKLLCEDIVKNSEDGIFNIATSSDGTSYCAVAKVYSKTGSDEWRCISSNAGYGIVTSTLVVNDCQAANCVNCVCQ